MKLGHLIKRLQEIEKELGSDCTVQVQGANTELGYVFGGEAATVQTVLDSGYLAEPPTVEITAIPDDVLVAYPSIKEFVSFLR